MAAHADTPDRGVSETTVGVPTKASPEEAESTTAAKLEPAECDAEKAADYDAVVDAAVEDNAAIERSGSHVRLALVVGLAVVIVLGGTSGWLGYHAYQSHHAQTQRQLFLQVGRQCALNLTTIDWQHADADVQRLLDSATGKFYEQFTQRKQPFIDVVKKAQSKSVGTVTEAGLESDSGDKAQALVAVSIQTSNPGVEDAPPREWRMRISLEQSGGEVKVSNVSFVQ